MPTSQADLPFVCEKKPATGAGGMVVTNNPLGSAAGAEILALGGNAIDAAVASLLALTVVEPMMVGITGGGVSHIRLADGRHVVIDALSTAGSKMHDTIYEPIEDPNATFLPAKDRRNMVGPSAVAVPGNLAGWCHMQAKYGRLPLADVVDPAIRLAARGFMATHYLNGAIRMHQADLINDPDLAAMMLPGGKPVEVGERVVMSDYAESLKLIQKEGAAALYGGALGQALLERLRTGGPDQGYLTNDDLTGYRPIEREAIMGTYRGHQIYGPPPPASSGVHVVQMLNMMENFDVAGMGFGSPELLHLMVEVIRVSFEDRRAASGDPAFVDVPVEKYTSKAYAKECLARLREIGGALPVSPMAESNNTTHVTVADKDGNIVAATHTINGLFGAQFMIPGTGIIPNNYMCNFDPAPGRAMSIAPGKRVPTSMAPMIVTKDGKPEFALGLPGAVRIFPSAMQAILNIVDHGMDLQHAVEAPRIWTMGGPVEIEAGYVSQQDALKAKGHDVKQVAHIAGGMNAVSFGEDGMMTGAACWRADGTPIALGGGLAQPGVRFAL